MTEQLNLEAPAQAPPMARPPGTGFIPTPEPGIYKDIDAELYHQWDAMSNSWLKVLGGKSPKHFRWQRDHPRSMTKSMFAGKLLHSLCLERFSFALHYAVGPDGLNRTAKKAWAEFEAANAPKPCIPKAEFDTACGMADSLMQHKRIRSLLTDGQPEVSIVWTDAETGIRCKARLDYLLPPCIGDIKTTSDGDEWAFAKAIDTYGYYQQAAFYLDGGRAAGLDTTMFAFATVESEAPHDCYICVPKPATIAAGRHAYKSALWAYRGCLQQEAQHPGDPANWPGRHEQDILELDMPTYALRREGIEERETL